MVTRIALTVRPDRPGDLEILVYSLDDFIRDNIAFFSFRPGYATKYVVKCSLVVYLNTCTCSGACCSGAIVGAIIPLLGSLGRTADGCPGLRDGSRARGVEDSPQSPAPIDLSQRRLASFQLQESSSSGSNLPATACRSLWMGRRTFRSGS